MISTTLFYVLLNWYEYKRVNYLPYISSDAVVLMTLHLSNKPPSVSHPYGYGHYESLGTLGVAALLIAAGLGTAQHAAMHMMPLLTSGVIKGEDIPGLEYVTAAIGCACLSVLVKEWLYRITLKQGKESQSPVLVANAWHHRTDALSSVVAIVGIGGYQLGFPFLDPAAGLVVAGMITKAGFEIGWTAIKDLTDQQREDDEITQRVEEIGASLEAKSRGEVADIHNIRCRRLGGDTLLDIHVSVNPKLSVTAAYQAANRVKQEIMRQIPHVSEVFVHIQAHPSRSKTLGVTNRDGRESADRRKLEKSSSASFFKPFERSVLQQHVMINPNPTSTIAVPSKIEAVRTKPQYKIERDIADAVSRANQAEIIRVSHCNVHYLVSEVDEVSDTRSLKQVAEVNLVMDKRITLARAEEVSKIAQQEILKLPFIHAVDIHVELFADTEES